jgi:Uma2 family endonuclease
MPASTLVSVEEYLHTSYHPDCDYVDGRVVERNVGELDHSDLQTELAVYFRSRRKRWGVHAFVEQRVQVSPTRFRVPDICVMLGQKPTEPIFRTPPFLIIEILSPEDRMPRLLERIDDYLRFGVGYAWVIDPGAKEGWVHTPAGVEPAVDGILRTCNPELDVSLPEIFAALREES